MNAGVARPQGLASQYIAAVRDVGTNYRASNGRGYSSNAKLDFHVDGADLTTLICFNKAKSGGQSMISSGVTANNIFLKEHPELADTAAKNFYFSRQNEQADDEKPFMASPFLNTKETTFSVNGTGTECSLPKSWKMSQSSPSHRKRRWRFWTIIMRPELMYTMYLEPGDMQILNNYTMFHSRTHYEDFDAPEEKRCLFRLWLAPPDL